jgi:hypothetical protein
MSRGTRGSRSFALALLASTAACGSVEQEDVGTIARGLNGSWTTANCTSQEEDLIAQAFGIINSRIGTSEYRQCLRSAFMIERHGVFVEDMIALMRVMPTKVRCVAPGTCGPKADACAPVPPFGTSIPEEMKIHKDYLGAVSASQLADTIVHEAAHTKGWTHFPFFSSEYGYPWSVTVQMGSCMAHLDTEGWSRLQPHGDTELSPVGGDGGQPFLLRCPSGARVTGATVDASTYVNRLRLRCSDGSYTARVGEFKDSTTTYTHNCSAGWSMVGFSGHADSILRNLRSWCVRDIDLESDYPSPQKATQWLGGSVAGTYAARLCPVGMAVVGAVGRSGARIDQVRWLCQDIDGAILPNPHAYGYRGTRTGNAKIGICSGNGVIHALFGYAGAELDKLGGECFPTTRDVWGAPVLMAQYQTRHAFDVNGGPGGEVFDKPCPWGEVLVGLRVRSGARIDAVGGVCAKPADWSAGKNVVSYTPLSGGSTGSYSTLLCPAREFVVGLKTWAKHTPEHDTTTIHGVAPYCRNLGQPLTIGSGASVAK